MKPLLVSNENYPAIDSYIEETKRRIKGKKVLDVGCLASYEQNIMKRHKEYRKATDQIVGVDINQDFLDKAKQQGVKDLFYCDATNKKDVESIVEKFGKFDIVIASDVIEHIGNHTLFVDNLKLAMRDNGSLFLTVPNMRGIRWFHMFYKDKIKINPDHVCWFDVITLSILLGRSQMKITEAMYHGNKDDKLRARELKLQYKTWMAGKLFVIGKKEG